MKLLTTYYPLRGFKQNLGIITQNLGIKQTIIRFYILI